MAVSLQMSLADVSLLARVQRPVVSMWRTRSAGSEWPFPGPVARVGGEERFDVDGVVTWLETTGRGKNPEVRDDAAGFASPPGLSLRDDPALYTGLTALLCLKAMTGQSLADMSADKVLELAAGADARDLLLATELSGLGPHLMTMAEYADHLAEAAFGPSEALERLLDQRFRHAQVEAVANALAPPVHALVEALARALARECGCEPPVYVDPTGAGSDLVLGVARAEADLAPEVVLLDAAAPGARLLWRRLRTQDLHVETAEALSSIGPAVVIAHHPLAGTGTAAGDQVLDAVDELALSLADNQRALVLAPASLLTDRLRNRGQHQLRSRVLRTGRVRAVVRLPAGLATHRSREALALWVLGPDFAGHDLEDRRVALIDVSDTPLSGLVVDQVRNDVLAAMAAPRLSRAHNFVLARLLTTSVVLAQSGSIFPPRVAAARGPADGAGAALQVEQLRVRRTAEVDALGGVTVEVAQLDVSGPVALGEAERQRLVRVLPGNREGFVLQDDGSVPVIGVAELTGTVPTGSRRLDRLAFLGIHRSARLTEPGDVVFCTSPRPRALVDDEGGSAVQYPARILRVHPARGEGLCPPVLAHAVNAQPERSRAWRGWLLPRVSEPQARTVAEALGALRREQAAVSSRLSELDNLRHTLVQGLTSGSLVLHTEDAMHHQKRDN